MTTSTRVLVLSNQAGAGLPFDGEIAVSLPSDEPLAVSVLRELRASGVVICDGDALFFPNAARGHRVAEVVGDGLSRVHGWDWDAAASTRKDEQ